MSKNLSLLLVDRSGSMAAIREKTIAGINSHVTKVVSDVEDTIWTLGLFDSDGELQLDYVYRAKAGNNVPTLVWDGFVPRGTTPLLDAIGQSLIDLDSFIDSLVASAKPEKVSIVIMTDGLENASIEHSSESIQEMIKEREDRGWQIVYLGANQDAFEVARGFGSVMGSTITYDKDSVPLAYAGASNTATSYFSGATAAEASTHTDLTSSKTDEDDPA